jgi:guanylate kinase
MCYDIKKFSDMYITKEKARKKITAALARLQGRIQFNNSGADLCTAKHVVFVGAPGTAKTATINALLQEKHHAFERARSVTSRPKRKGELGRGPYIFKANEEKFQRTGSGVLEGTVYNINGAHYGVSLKEITRIISSGKHFITVTSVEGAEQLAELFGDDIVLVFCKSSREVRSQRLFAQYSLLENATAEIAARLDFGDSEIERYQASRLPFITLEHKDLIQPLHAANVITSHVLMSCMAPTRVSA